MISDLLTDLVAVLVALGVMWLGVLAVRAVRAARRAWHRDRKLITAPLTRAEQAVQAVPVRADLGTLTDCTWCASLEDNATPCTCTVRCEGIAWCGGGGNAATAIAALINDLHKGNLG
jgi:hypothetical protein